MKHFLLASMVFLVSGCMTSTIKYLPAQSFEKKQCQYITAKSFTKNKIEHAIFCVKPYNPEEAK